MKISFREIELERRFPLAISRGVSRGSVNLFVFVESDGFTGVGEMSPGSLTGAATAGEGQADLERLIGEGIDALSIKEIWQLGRDMNVAPCAHAALDIALWDVLAKQANMPLHKLLGLSPHAVATSVTVGINPPDIAAERTAEMLARTRAIYLKVKLGSPDGVEADKAMYVAVEEAAQPFDVGMQVDANGGWSCDDAKMMMRWLADRGVDYIEQPLVEGAEDDLPALFKDRPMPIYVDESCRFASDIPRYADAVDGVNIKLMKCGGITEALRIIATARAFGLGTMIGCMSESSVSIAAGAAIGALFDHIDLDSHLNLAVDPAGGVAFTDGVVVVSKSPGHGASLNE